MKLIDVAKGLLLWNTKNLTYSAALKKSDIGFYFADRFQVRANGRHYEANHDSYFDFLNQFRTTIRSINYDVYDFIEGGPNVVIPMTAHIVRLGGTAENFEAILIPKFDQSNKITLWHEVYMRVEAEKAPAEPL